MTVAELETLAYAVAKLAFVAGLVGALAAHVLMLLAARVVGLLSHSLDRRMRIAQARKRAALISGDGC